MHRILIAVSILFAITSTGCPDDGVEPTPCFSAEGCDDGDPCTDDLCNTMSECAHVPITEPSPECPTMCQQDADCEDDDPCTIDDCSSELVCTNDQIPSCAPCLIDEDCEDGDACTTDTCAVDGFCANDPVDSPACAACVPDGVCDPDESCFCGDCATDAQCAKPADCIEIDVALLDGFGEGPIVGADGSDLLGAGTDIGQAFDNDGASGVSDFAQLLDHDDCFAAGLGCLQFRVNYTTTPVEFMVTSGSWLRNDDDTGQAAGFTAYEYTQGAGGTMNYVVGGRCLWGSWLSYEP